MLPLSNQQSNTSEMRCNDPFPRREGIVRWSMLVNKNAVISINFKHNKTCSLTASANTTSWQVLAHASPTNVGSHYRLSGRTWKVTTRGRTLPSRTEVTFPQCDISHQQQCSSANQCLISTSSSVICQRPRPNRYGPSPILWRTEPTQTKYSETDLSLWRSETFAPDSSSSSATEPMHTTCQNKVKKQKCLRVKDQS